jgi:hypothetical protein
VIARGREDPVFRTERGGRGDDHELGALGVRVVADAAGAREHGEAIVEQTRAYGVSIEREEVGHGGAFLSRSPQLQHLWTGNLCAPFGARSGPDRCPARRAAS